MYAIVKTGGKQYRVEQGMSLLVERLRADEGAKVALDPLLFVDGEKVIDGDGVKVGSAACALDSSADADAADFLKAKFCRSKAPPPMGVRNKRVQPLPDSRPLSVKA